MLLHVVKNLHPDLANMTREILKAKNGAEAAAFKELLPVIKHVLDTKNIEPTGDSNKLWEIICFSNSNYAGDLVSRRRICGFILYELGILDSWQSKSQKSVSFS